MKSRQEILDLLEQLESHNADSLEGQDLDFKEWNEKSMKDAVDLVVKMAVCMANGEGGTIVFGVRDKGIGRKNVILGVPNFVDRYELQKAVYERTDPHLTPVFEWIDVPEGHGRILIMDVYPGMPPYTETNGSATIRIGKDCRPLTGSMRKELFAKTGVSDFTSTLINGDWKLLFSPAAMERVRKYMEEERAPDTLCKMNDEDLLVSIEALKEGKFSIAGLLIFGKDKAIQKYIPNHKWDYRKMLSSTDYSIKDSANSAIPIGLYELERYVGTDNPITTLQVGFIHPEFPTYPQIALREAIINAFAHRDFRIPGSVMLKQYKDKLELTNPGGFINGITAENILHHPPMPRNNHLVDILDKIRLVNRSNLGISRIYRALLTEGKEPPQYREIGESIEVIFTASDLVPAFRNFIRTLTEKGFDLDVDHLIILHYLMRHREIDTFTASRIIQRNQDQTRETLSYLENYLRLVHAGGTIRNRYYTLERNVYERLESSVQYDRDKRLDIEYTKIKILSVLKERKLTNTEIRQLTDLSRYQVIRLMKELENSGVRLFKSGKFSYYYLDSNI